VPINTRVMNTGELFEATNEKGSSRDAHALETGKSYCGFLYHGSFRSARFATGEIVFDCIPDRVHAEFAAKDLEEIARPITIKHVSQARGRNEELET